MNKFILKIIAVCLIACTDNQGNSDVVNKENNLSYNEKNTQDSTSKNESSTSLPTDIFYPVDYRNWTHVKSMILEKGHPLYESFGGLHHIYANNKAMEGYRSGVFPDGSVIVFDLLDVNIQNNAIMEGSRKVIGVMYKNSAVFSETGGWIFGAFKDQKGEKLDIEWKEKCYSCHLSQKVKDYVFSSFRE